MRDFVYKSNGVNAYLLYELAEEDQLDTVSLAMLTHNRIDGLVSMQYRQMDSSKQLLFDISGKIRVSDLLQSVLSPKALLLVLRGIAAGLISAEEYRLLEESLLITQDCIFVDLKTFETSVLCLPLKNLPDAEFNLRDTLREIVYHAKYHEEAGSEQIAKALNYLNNEMHIDPMRFKEFLDQLLMDKPAPKADPVPVSPVTAGGNGRSDDHVAKAKPDHDIDIPVVETEPSAEVSEERASIFNIFRKGKKSDKAATKKEKSHKQKKSEKKDDVNIGFDFDFPGQDDSKPEADEEPAVSAPPCDPTVPISRGEHIDYGDTVVIKEHDKMRGGINESLLQPYLIWQRTNEKINITKDSFRIGRKASEVDFCIRENKTVGRIHAEIIAKCGEYYLMDLNSANHTYLNGKQIPPMTEQPLTHGCKIVFSDEEFEFHMI